MPSSLVLRILAFACLGSFALSSPLDKRQAQPPATTTPTGPIPSGGLSNNDACCGYELVNRGGAYFRYKHEMDFSTVRLFKSCSIFL
jgi:hypothetical protein